MQFFWAQTQTITHLTSGNLLASYNAFIKAHCFSTFHNESFVLYYVVQPNVLLVCLQTLIYDKALTIPSIFQH